MGGDIFLDWLLLRETWMSVSVVYLEGKRNSRSSSSMLPSESPLWAAGALLCWYSRRPCEEPALVDPTWGCRSWIIQASALVIPWLKAEGGCWHSFPELRVPRGPPLHALHAVPSVAQPSSTELQRWADSGKRSMEPRDEIRVCGWASGVPGADVAMWLLIWQFSLSPLDHEISK